MGDFVHRSTSYFLIHKIIVDVGLKISSADEKSETASVEEEVIQNWSQWFISELTANPLNIVLILAIIILIYKIFKSDDSQPSEPPPPPLPRMKKKDMTLTELKKYDGSGPDGRVCVGVLGKFT